jgi:hypothetical protein
MKFEDRPLWSVRDARGTGGVDKVLVNPEEEILNAAVPLAAGLRTPAVESRPVAAPAVADASGESPPPSSAAPA